MISRDYSFAIALAASAVVHAGILLVLSDGPGGNPSLAAPARPATETVAYVAVPPPPPPDLIFGASDGSGDAANTAPGDDPMLGRESRQRQAFLSRDPKGPGHVGDDPSMSVLPQGNGGSPEAASAEMASTPPPEPAPAPLGVTEQLDKWSAPHVARARPQPIKPDIVDNAPAVAVAMAPQPDAEELPLTAKPPQETEESPPPAKPQKSDDAPPPAVKPQSDAETPPPIAKPAPPAEEATQAPTPPGAPGSPSAAADPAIMSDSESDPFAGGKGVEFRDGRVDAKMGRKVKTVRPKLTLAAQYDLLSMQSPKMVVRIHIDETGEVRKVDIIKSSGSDSADQAVKVALYQWWIEPKKSRAGVPVGDMVEFPITWH